MAENQVYLIKSGSNSFVEETEAVVGISGGKVGIGTTHPQAFFHVTGDTQIDGDLTVKGDLTTVNSTTIQVDDKNIDLGVGSTSDAAADGGGITLHAGTNNNKTFNWLDDTDAWTSSEHLYLVNGKHFSADELRALGSDGLKLADATTSGVLIKGGKVGIHQATPAYDLDVDGSGNFTSLYVDGNAVLTGEGSIFGKWEDGTSEGEIFYTGGNVGVGTDNPEYPFHVFGNSVVDGNFIVNGESGNLNVSKFNVSGDSITLNYRGDTLTDSRGGLIVKDSSNASKSFEYVESSDFWLSSESVKITDGKELQTDKVRAIDGDGLYLHDDAGNGIFVKDGGDVGIKNITPSVALDVSGSAKISADLNVVGYVEAQDLKFTTINGDSATSQNDIIAWNATNDAWEVKAASQLGLGAGGSSSEVPESIESSVTQGATQMQVSYGPFDTVPKVSATLEIDGDGPIIPFAISGVSNSSYNVIFAQEVPNSNYSIHTVFGGYDVHWRTGDNASISYAPGSVYIDKDLTVSGDLFVQGNQTIINTTKLDVEDKNITIAKNIASTDDTMVDAGITWGNDNVVKMLYSKNKGFSFNGDSVGIGTTDPDYDLDVHGWINAQADALSADAVINLAASNADNYGAISRIKSTSESDSNGASSLTFSTRDSDNAINERMRIDSSGNVGIGTTNPGASLHVNGNDFILGGGHLSTNPQNGLIIAPYGEGVDIGGGNLDVYAGRSTGIGVGGDITFLTSPAGQSSGEDVNAHISRLKITSAGNVGIGVTSPNHPLEVRTPGSKYGCHILDDQGLSLGGLFVQENGDTTDGLSLYLKQPGGTTKVRISATDTVDTFFNAGNVGIGTTDPGAKLEVARSDQSETESALKIMRGDTGVDHRPTAPILNVFNGQAGGTEVFRVQGNGNVGIGTTNPTSFTGFMGSSAIATTINSNNGVALNLQRGTDVNNAGIGAMQFINTNNSSDIGTGSGSQLLGLISIQNVTSDGNAGSDAGGNLRLYTKQEAGSCLERMRITSAGNVGIGTTDPNAKLEISGGGTDVWLKTNNITNRSSNTMAGQNYINLTNQLPTDENSFEIGPGYINLNRDDNVPINQLSFGMNGMLSAAFEVGGTTNSDHSLRFKVGQNDSNKAGIERMRISSSGNVGIGTTNPSAKLEIEKDSYGTLAAGQGHMVLDTVGVAREKNKGPFINFRVPHSSSTSEDMANIGAVCSDSTASSRKADLVFWTRSNNFTEKMRIAANGNVGIGTTNPGEKLHIEGSSPSIKIKATNQSGLAEIKFQTDAGDQNEDSWSIRASNHQPADNHLLEFMSYSTGELTSALAIKSNGNVGIGTTSPSGSLHVNTVSLSIGSVTVTDGGGDPPVVSTQITGTALNTKISNGDRIKINNEIFTVSDVQSTTLTLSGTPSTAGTYEAFTDNNGLIVTSAGNVGIGTTNPGAVLHVAPKNNVDANGDPTNESFFKVFDNATSGLGQGRNGGVVYIDANYYLETSDIFAVNGRGDNKLTIKGSGNVGIGTTDPGTYKLNVNGNINANGVLASFGPGTTSETTGVNYHADNSVSYNLLKLENTSVIMNVAGNGDVSINGTVEFSSDDRVKHNEQNIVGAIETLGKITPKKYIKTTEMYEADHNFELDEDGNPVDANGEPVEHTVEAGVIAQQVLTVDELAFAVSPEGVDEDGNVTSPHGLNYNSLFTYAIAAIQEQQSIIEDLKSQNASLESRISALES